MEGNTGSHDGHVRTRAAILGDDKMNVVSRVLTPMSVYVRIEALAPAYGLT